MEASPSHDYDSSDSLAWGAQVSKLLLSDAQPVMSPEAVRQLSPTTLAYLGDGVYELYVRLSFLLPPKRIQAYHHHVVDQVRAETQAVYLRSLHPHLSATELDIVKRGRNGANHSSRRRNLEVYRQASALETLIGYLYLTNPERLMQLLTHLPLGAEGRPPALLPSDGSPTEISMP